VPNFDAAAASRLAQSAFDREAGTIRASAYVDPDIYRLEVERIFRRCWLFWHMKHRSPKREIS
jgi:hypothetical protein